MYGEIRGIGECCGGREGIPHGTIFINKIFLEEYRGVDHLEKDYRSILGHNPLYFTIGTPQGT